MNKFIFVLLIISLCFSPLFATTATNSNVEIDSSILELETETQDYSKVSNTTNSDIAKGLMIGLAVTGAAIGIGNIISQEIESTARQPEVAPILNKTSNTGLYLCLGLVAGTIAFSFTF